MTEEFIRENFKGLDWEFICGEEQLSLDFIREFKDKVFWCDLIWNRPFTEREIEEFKDYLKNYWYLISLNQNISHEFLDKWKDKYHL